MPSSGPFDTCPSGYVEQGFSGPESGSYGMRWSISDSPTQSFVFLPGDDSRCERQSSSASNTTSQGGFAPMYSAANCISSSTLDQLDPRVQRYIQELRATPSNTQTSHYPYTVFSSMAHDDLQESLSSVAHTPSMTPYPVHNGSPDTASSHYGGNLTSVRKPHLSHSAIHPPCLQIHSTSNVVAREYSVVPNPAYPATAPLSLKPRVPTGRNSREARSTPSSPYRPTRASSTQFQSVSPNDTILHTCGWINDDGGLCMAPISRSTISEHLITHGITNLEHDHYLSCRWVGCRLRGGKEYMKRESIVRHIREKHLQYRRNSN